MKTLLNPETGATIKNLMFKGTLYALPVGEKKTFSDEVAEKLLENYPFLEEIQLEGKFVCKYGDYAHDKKIAVIAHERGHKEDPTEQGKVYVSPQDIADAKKRGLYDQEGIPTGQGQVDRDGFEWYGEGLVVDNDMRPTMARRPGHFV